MRLHLALDELAGHRLRTGSETGLERRSYRPRRIDVTGGEWRPEIWNRDARREEGLTRPGYRCGREGDCTRLVIGARDCIGHAPGWRVRPIAALSRFQMETGAYSRGNIRLVIRSCDRSRRVGPRASKSDWQAREEMVGRHLAGIPDGAQTARYLHNRKRSIVLSFEARECEKAFSASLALFLHAFTVSGYEGGLDQLRSFGPAFFDEGVIQDAPSRLGVFVVEGHAPSPGGGGTGFQWV